MRRRRRIRSTDEFRLLNVSGVEGFDFEAQIEGEALLGFACDEADGPVTVTFAPKVEGFEIDLAALRKLLDDVEAELLRERAAFAETMAFYDEPGS